MANFVAENKNKISQIMNRLNRKTDPWNMDWEGFLQGIK